MPEDVEPTPAEMHKALFANLVMSLVSTAMQHLGKLKSPATGRVAVDLSAAQDVIDMVDMLEAKTRGNRDAEEESFIKGALGTLQMNFVETAAATPAAEDAAPGASPEPAPGPADPPGKDGDDDERKRFHKSYG
jgi:hypothetical protein